ncbi:ABC-2 type transport system ATP-binding protein/heme exporter protein A [Cyclonatronum proteinivorum]|uniref:ABC-2 type transport system ATP-binding protein/heme exporter protein A n=1 Tax=Cyclonatronum proteinivorum TaxID=1457365 RepID=A0A345UN85_9BACT|nr:ABC-2 type transport system ATP-binding protein/heme exporter protein A [Cyclonatronum proteinivorum]
MIFRRIEAEIGPGVHGVAGPNGSGKSTLMKCIAGLIRPDAGKISWEVEGSPLKPQQLYRQLGFSAPYIRMYNELSCTENIRLVCELSGRAVGDDEIRAQLSVTGLQAKTETWYGQLSSGQQQRVRLVSALIKKTPFLLLDEPGTNLDTAGFAYIGSVTAKAREEGQTLIIASNESRELDLCDKIIRIK